MKGRGAEGILKERIKTNTGRGGVKHISLLTLWKRIDWFFKQQIAFLLIRCLVVAESFIKRLFFKLFFEYGNIFIAFIVCIYLCRKHCHLLFWIYKKIILFSLFTPQLSIQKFISILYVKWTGMNKVGACRKWEDLIKHTFWMTPKSFCCN